MSHFLHYRWAGLPVWLILLTAHGQPTASEGVRWASKLVGVSSERKGETYGYQYQGVQALGPPSVVVNAASPAAWEPLLPDGPGDEWIEVGFETPTVARQVIICENVNPGAVTEVWVSDTQGKPQQLYQNPNPAAKLDNLLAVEVPPGTPAISRVKVVIRAGAVRGRNQVDAIGLSAGTKRIAWEVAVSPDAPAKLQRENLGPAINTAGQEVAPVIAPDGRTLYFTRNHYDGNIGSPNRQDVWVSTVGPKGWSEAVNIGPPINNASDNAVSGISAGGRTLYLLNVYLPSGDVQYGFSKSVRTAQGWGFPQPLVIKNNYNLPANDADFSVFTELTLSPDEQTLILSARRRDTQGDRDLYVSHRLADGTWSELQNVGMDINTADTESAPFLAADGKTLYFTSKGHPGYGNGDIFVSRRLDDTWRHWSRPLNVGPSINTPLWDGYFSIPASGDVAYFSSTKGSLGEDDIFRIRLYPAIRPLVVVTVSGSVLDAKTKKAVAATVAAVPDSANADTIKADYDPASGDYKLLLPAKAAYTLRALKSGYFSNPEPLRLAEKPPTQLRRNLYLTKAEAGQTITMRDVLFAQSQAVLLPGAETELDRIVAMLSANPAMTILVEGHTDNRGDWELNRQLSAERVKTVKAYLMQKGIAQTRIQTKAWGASKPIASNETEEKRRLNRRVEFTILTP